MSDYFAPADFNKFLAELDNANNATDMSYMDLLGPNGNDFDHVDVNGGLGPADDLHPKISSNGPRPHCINPPMDISLLDTTVEDDHGGCSPRSDPPASPQAQQAAVSSANAALPPKHTCEECGESFEYEFRIHEHIRRLQHGYCRAPGCKERFDSFEARDSHECRSHVEGHVRVQLANDLTCADCMEEFSSNSQLQNHANEAQHSPFACTCGKKFARRDVLYRHIDAFGDDLPKYHCQFCKRHRGRNGFRRRDHLLQHVRGYHKFEANGKIGDIRPSRRGKYSVPPVCPHSECEFHRDNSFKDLSRDEQRRTKPFETQAEYTRHMKTAHDYTPFPCDVAGCSRTGAKGYARQKDLINHRKKEHLEAPDYKPKTRASTVTCTYPGCGSQQTPGSLYWHFGIHHGVWN